MTLPKPVLAAPLALAALGLLFGQLPVPQLSGSKTGLPGKVTFTVLSSITREPMPGIGVTFGKPRVIPPGARAIIGPAMESQTNATTNAQGQATFSNVQPGTYLVRSSRPQPKASAIPPIVVDSGANVEVTLVVIPQAVIHGKVTDASGKPLQAMLVEVMEPDLASNVHEPAMKVAESAATDAQGQYTLTVREPGFYLVRATPPYMDGAAPGSALATVYYPASEDADHAQAIDAATLVDVSANFEIPERATRHIRGRVAGGNQALLSAFPYPEGLHEMTPPHKSLFYADTDGHFDLQLLPGRYWITVERAGRPGRPLASQLVTVNDTDVEGVMLSPQSPISLSGFVRMPAGMHVLQGAAVELSGVGPPFTGNVIPRAIFDPSSGAFQIKDVVPLRYLVNLIAVPDAYVESIEAGGHSIQGNLFDAAVDPGPLTINLALAKGSVKGHVTFGAKPVGTLMVTATPEGAFRQRNDLVRIAWPPATGVFEITHLAPVPYRIQAFEVIESVAVVPEYLDRYPAKHIEPGNTDEVEIPLIPNKVGGARSSAFREQR